LGRQKVSAATETIVAIQALIQQVEALTRTRARAIEGG